MTKKELLEKELLEIEEQERKEYLESQKQIFNRFKDAKFLLQKRNEREDDWAIQLIEIFKVESVVFEPTNDTYPCHAKGSSLSAYINYDKNCTVSESNDTYASIGSHNQEEYLIINENEYKKYLLQIKEIRVTFIESLKSLLT